MEGSSITSNITVASANGFSGTVTLAQPSTQPWVTATLNTSSVSVTPSIPASVALNATVVGPIPFDDGKCATMCQDNVSVTGSTGSYSLTTFIQILAYGKSFVLYSSQNVPIIEGRSGSVNLTLFGFLYAGSVSLTATVAPGGPRVTVNPAQVAISYEHRQNTTVTIDSRGLQLGDYNVTVTATELASPYVSHHVKLDVFVWAGFQGPPPHFSILSSLLANPIGITGLIFFGSFLLVTFLMDRRARKRNGNSMTTAGGLSSPPASQD